MEAGVLGWKPKPTPAEGRWASPEPLEMRQEGDVTVPRFRWRAEA
jgi:hypothetical protein